MVGCGGIAKGHLEAIEKYPEQLRLVGCCDSSPAAASAIAEKRTAYGPVETFTDLSEALATLRGRLDAALVLSPHHLHSAQAVSCMDAGLPVLIEKPAACSVEEMRALHEAEHRTGQFIQAGQMQRFGTAENWIKRWIASPDFGDPRLFNLDIYQNIQGYVSDKPDAWILDKNRAGGGIVISVGIHILDLLRFWFEDDFVEVFASARFDPPFVNGAESQCVATLRTRQGITGTLNASYTVSRTPYSQRSLVFGTHGTLAQHMEKIGGGYAGGYFISTDGGLPSPEWNMMYSGFRSVYPLVEADDGPSESPMVLQLLAFARAVRAGKAEENSLERNFNTIATIDAIARSMTSGKPEKVAIL
jgi:predicted dehydrogenase